MIALLIFALIVLCIAGLAVWAIRAIPLPAPFGVIATVVVCLIAILAIANRAGVF